MFKRNAFPSKDSFETLNELYDKILKTGLKKYTSDGDKFIYVTNNNNDYCFMHLKQNLDIEIYFSSVGLFSSNILQFGERKTIYINGVDFFSISRKKYKDNDGFYDEWISKYKDSFKQKTYFNSFTRVPSTEFERYIDDKEAHILEDMLARLYLIFDQLNHKEIEISSDKDEVTIFRFDPKKVKFNSKIVKRTEMYYGLSRAKLPFSKQIASSISDINVTAGKLYISTFQFNVIMKQIKHKNGINSRLRTILFYAVNDNGDVKYVTDCCKEYDYEKTVRDNVVNLFRLSGLYDEIITDNPVIYYLFHKELKTMNIDMKYLYECSLLNKTCGSFISFIHLLANNKILEFSIKALENQLKSNLDFMFNEQYSCEDLYQTIDRLKFNEMAKPPRLLEFNEDSLEIIDPDDFFGSDDFDDIDEDDFDDDIEDYDDEFDEESLINEDDIDDSNYIS